MSNATYSIDQVCRLTGLEASEIRFYEAVFRDFLTFTQMGLDANRFNDDHVQILSHIRELIHTHGRSIDDVKKELRQVFQTKGASAAARAQVHRARVISVTSGKGGVGKTTLVCNLALALARRGKRVGIFDADLGLANCHILLGIKPQFNLSHLIEDGFRLEDIVCEGPEGIRVISGGQGVRELANLTDSQRRALLREMDRLEREVDVLLIDTGAGISENVLRFAAFADEVIVVTTANIAATADAFSIIKILLEMDPAAKIGLVANEVKNMYHAKNVFHRINACAEKHLDYGLGDLGHILADENVKVANQLRQPLVLSCPQSPAAQCIESIVDTILSEDVFRNHKKPSCFAELIGAIKRNMAGVSA
ncbi:MAG: P-loop NTPase [Candidatus Sumerlaeia bacterium]|nr:P-loop NTPase [Candidatus Sumerlaeia bacterium]